MAQNLRERLLANVERLSRTPLTQLLASRYTRLMQYGAYQA
jgi:acetyl-CoA carboxylase carboxyl transferase subunit alpha